MLDLYIVGTWPIETDGYEVRRLGTGGRVLHTERLRDRPREKHSRLAVKAKAARTRKLGSLCRFTDELEALAASLADRRDVRARLIDAVLPSDPLALVRSRLTHIPSVILVDAEEVVRVWPVDAAEDLAEKHFSAESISQAITEHQAFKEQASLKREAADRAHRRRIELLELGERRTLTLDEMSELLVLRERHAIRG